MTQAVSPPAGTSVLSAAGAAVTDGGANDDPEEAESVALDLSDGGRDARRRARSSRGRRSWKNRVVNVKNVHVCLQKEGG